MHYERENLIISVVCMSRVAKSMHFLKELGYPLVNHVDVSFEHRFEVLVSDPFNLLLLLRRRVVREYLIKGFQHEFDQPQHVLICCWLRSTLFVLWSTQVCLKVLNCQQKMVFTNVCFLKHLSNFIFYLLLLLNHFLLLYRLLVKLMRLFYREFVSRKKILDWSKNLTK